ncbi:MAG: hypothetical protein ACPIOQ_21725 [Promethearchaeia archaeon]
MEAHPDAARTVAQDKASASGAESRGKHSKKVAARTAHRRASTNMTPSCRLRASLVFRGRLKAKGERKMKIDKILSSLHRGWREQANLLPYLFFSPFCNFGRRRVEAQEAAVRLGAASEKNVVAGVAEWRVWVPARQPGARECDMADSLRLEGAM